MKKIKFILENGIVLIPGKVNDVLGYFIFDTGSMKTALNKTYFNYIPLPQKVNRFFKKILTFNKKRKMRKFVHLSFLVIF